MTTNSSPTLASSLSNAYKGAPELLTDQYELTMIDAAIQEEHRTGHPVASRKATFEVFSRRLPDGRRYGVVAGTERILRLLSDFRFSENDLTPLSFLSTATKEWLRAYRFTGDIDGYREGELYFPGSPVLTVQGSFAECVLLETFVLSVLNHDSAIASAGARMVTAADGRTIIEMGSRRTHEEAAVAAARSAYLAGFASTSNLAASARYGIPAAGTSAHAFTLLHTGESGPDETAAFRAQIAAQGIGTTLLVDTYDITRGVSTAIDVAGPSLGGVRIDSGDLGVLARQVRQQLDSLGAHNTAIVVSGDLDEFSIAALRAEPVDIYGVGTSLVTGSGAPTAEFVYKLVAVDGIPVVKRSSHKETIGGAKRAIRTHRDTGVIVEEIILRADQESSDQDRDSTGQDSARVGTLATRPVTVPLMRSGHRVETTYSLQDGRNLLRDNLASLPWEGLSLSHGEAAIPTRFVGFPQVRRT